ncbi:recombinase family protein [Phenylobacterium terrae]|uniref:Recombinase family protein n=1 Tax=Phenylobacterium terrae TaxID=2665495 RepID=A0ABW4N5X3_9CAUL
MATALRRAAQYLRMSTDQQPFSLASQAAVIAQHARGAGLDIVRTYTDAGISGLTFAEREGLRSLVADVVSGAADFSVVLVADVSRWGRFQDLDEAAHYEFLCRQAGIVVRYCGEPPEDEDGALGSLAKQLKRIMAAEFSRERSELVRAAGKAAAAAGRKRGGRLPMGVARMLLNADGTEAGPLKPGERKTLREQAVGFAHGPPAEVEAVRTIFRAYVDERLGLTDIARRMAAEGPPRPQGGPWTATAVLRVLRHELYAGVYVFNRGTEALRTRRRPLPESEWVRAAVMAPVTPPETFARARTLLALRSRYTDEDLLTAARRLLAKEGRLTAALMARSGETPAVRVYQKRFGSLTALYRRIGYVPGPVRRVSDEQLLEDLRALKRRRGVASGPLLTAQEGLSEPSTYHRRFGSLRRAYVAAGLGDNFAEVRRAWRRARAGGAVRGAADA